MAMVVVTAALIGFFGFLIMRVTTPQLTTLFTDLSYEDSSAIIKDLERQGIPFEMRNDGSVLMVPKDKVTRLRMKLAESGLPKGGGVGYEIFDKSDAIGATSFVQNINHLRAMEGELARTIRAIDRVQFARVHLVLPERPLFSRETPEPSASIVLRVRGALEPAQVRAIRHLAASAVNGLKPQRVSIVDERGNLLANGATDTVRRRRDGRGAARRLRAQAARSGRSDRVLGGRLRPCARAAFGGFRLQPRHPDLRPLRSRRPRRAIEPVARGADRLRRPRQPGHRQQRIAGRATATTAAARRPRIRARRPRKSSTTRSPASPRRRSPRPDGSTGSRSQSWSTASTARTRRARPPTRRARRTTSIASAPWFVRPSASTASAATRWRSSTSALPTRPTELPAAEPSTWLCKAAVHQG